MTEAEDFVGRMVAAIDSRDAGAFASCYATDAVAHDPQVREPLRGRDAIREDMEQSLRVIADFRFRTFTVLEAGGLVVFEGVGSGAQMVPEDPSKPGELVNMRGEWTIACFLRRDTEGLIAEERRYHGTLTVLGPA
jgi:hypothetical protein